MKGMYKAQLLKNTKLSPQIYLMELLAPELTALALPGQFVMLLLNDNYAPLLRRPFSLAGINKKEGCIKLIYQKIGKGTIDMSKWQIGHQVDLLGPLGKGFSWTTKAGTKTLLAGGGLGIAPLLPLAKTLRHHGKEVTAFLGGRTKKSLFGLKELEELGCDIQIATEDGSLGHHGFITQPLEQALNTAIYEQLYCCGPSPFLKVIANLSIKYDLPTELSLEERMACGLGACMGCTVQVRWDNQELRNCRVCADGPVFKAKEVVFDGQFTN